MSDDSDDNPTYEDEFALGADDDYDDKGGIISGGYVEEIEDSSSSSDAAQQEEKIRRSRRSRLTVASAKPKYADSSSSEEDAQDGGDISYFEENDGEEEVERVGTKNAKRSSPRKRSSSSRSTAIEDKELPNRLPRRSRGRAVSLNPKNKSSFANVDYVENEKNISEEIYNDGQELEEVGKRENVKRLSPRKRGSSSKSSAKESAPPKTISSKLPKSKVEDDIEGTDAKDHKNDNKPSAKSPHKSESSAKDDNFSAENEGIDILIPHSLLNISRQSRKECNMLVQVEPNDEEASMHLDFIGQSGAIGRFEADENGVILDLKGYQYRGTIRPGPTAMVVALTRDDKLKVESITDEFVTLDTNARTDVMAKLDAVVEGNMDESYMVRDENVNDNKRGGDNDNKGKKGGTEDSDEDDKGKGKKGKKRASVSKSSGGAAAKKKRTSSTKKR